MLGLRIDLLPVIVYHPSISLDLLLHVAEVSRCLMELLAALLNLGL